MYTDTTSLSTLGNQIMPHGALPSLAKNRNWHEGRTMHGIKMSRMYPWLTHGNLQRPRVGSCGYRFWHDNTTKNPQIEQEKECIHTMHYKNSLLTT